MPTSSEGERFTDIENNASAIITNQDGSVTFEFDERYRDEDGKWVTTSTTISKEQYELGCKYPFDFLVKHPPDTEEAVLARIAAKNPKV